MKRDALKSLHTFTLLPSLGMGVHIWQFTCNNRKGGNHCFDQWSYLCGIVDSRKMVRQELPLPLVTVLCRRKQENGLLIAMPPPHYSD